MSATIRELVLPSTPTPWDGLALSSSAAWFSTPPAAREWLLRDARTGSGVLPSGKVGLVVGEGGVSKTMALVQLAVAVATGTRWLGAFDVAQRGRVLLILGEEDADEVHRRAYNARRSSGAHFPEDGALVVLPLHGVPAAMLGPHGEPAAFARWLAAFVAESGPYALVILDPLSRFAGPEAETDNAAATAFVQGLEALAASAGGATVLAAHHTNKGARGPGGQVSGASARGSSGFTDGCRWVATLAAERVRHEAPEADARLGELVTFAVPKSNYARKPEPLALRRDLENGGALVPLDTADRAIIAQAQASADPKARRATERATEREDLARAVLDALAAAPGPVAKRRLFASVRAVLPCSYDTFDAVLVGLGARVVSLRGPRGAVLFSPCESEIPQ
ncbi:MAG: AAA family ATPase [Polyangiaceae bacterium]